ncbi:MAG: LLM class flavin-dependent oxidoreductase [Chloroflexi bacterium]|nr:LLM class flavin-dependent oxidoreductase [Chloroflexota bacterium]
MEIGIGVKFKRAPDAAQSWSEVYEEWIEYARVADRLGYDFIVVPEHHSVAIGYNPTPFLTLTALARETERIRLATQPLLLPLYHPVHVAEQLAVLDLLSNGRAMLGIGVGYREGDFEAFGVPRHERGDRTDEALTILLGALRERGFSHEGRYHSASGVDLLPPPVQRPHPKVYVTARSRPALARAVRFGLGVNTLHREAIGRGVYADYCELAGEQGVDPATLDFTIVRNGYIAADAAEAVRIGAPFIEGRTEYMAAGEFAGRDEYPREVTQVAADTGASFATEGELIGTPAMWIEAMQADIEALSGPIPFTGWTLGIRPEGMSLADGLSALELFAAEVLPWVHAQEPR